MVELDIEFIVKVRGRPVKFTGRVPVSAEEIHREILNRNFIDLAKYLVDLKNRGLSVKLIRKALVKNINILNNKITAENLIDYRE